jgi:virginiamycin B lyase
VKRPAIPADLHRQVLCEDYEAEVDVVRLLGFVRRAVGLLTVACLVAFLPTTVSIQARADVLAQALPNVAPSGIILGPDHNLWFAETGAIGRVSPAGVITSFPLAHHRSDHPTSLTIGPDSAIWFLLPNTIGRITLSGTISAATISTLSGGHIGDESKVADLIVGPDKRLWYVTEDTNNFHYLMSLGFSPRTHPTSGAQTINLQKTLNSDFVNTDKASDPQGVVDGHDSTVWFIEYEDNPAFPLNIVIGKIAANNRVSLFPISLAALLSRFTQHPDQACKQGVCLPEDLTQTRDGAVWFTMFLPLIGHLAPNGHVSSFPLRPAPGESPDICQRGIPTLITHDQQDTIWYGELTYACIGRLTPRGVITTLVSPHRLDNIDGLVADAQGNIWFTLECVNSIGRLTPGGHIALYHIPHTALDAGQACPETM